MAGGGVDLRRRGAGDRDGGGDGSERPVTELRDETGGRAIGGSERSGPAAADDRRAPLSAAFDRVPGVLLLRVYGAGAVGAPEFRGARVGVELHTGDGTGEGVAEGANRSAQGGGHAAGALRRGVAGEVRGGSLA